MNKLVALLLLIALVGSASAWYSSDYYSRIGINVTNTYFADESYRNLVCANLSLISLNGFKNCSTGLVTANTTAEQPIEWMMLQNGAAGVNKYCNLCFTINATSSGTNSTYVMYNTTNVYFYFDNKTALARTDTPDLKTFGNTYCYNAWDYPLTPWSSETSGTVQNYTYTLENNGIYLMNVTTGGYQQWYRGLTLGENRTVIMRSRIVSNTSANSNLNTFFRDLTLTRAGIVFKNNSVQQSHPDGTSSITNLAYTPTSNWVVWHMMFINNGTTYYIFKDGQLALKGTNGTAALLGAGRMQFGTDYSGTGNGVYEVDFYHYSNANLQPVINATAQTQETNGVEITPTIITPLNSTYFAARYALANVSFTSNTFTKANCTVYLENSNLYQNAAPYTNRYYSQILTNNTPTDYYFSSNMSGEYSAEKHNVTINIRVNCTNGTTSGYANTNYTTLNYNLTANPIGQAYELNSLVLNISGKFAYGYFGDYCPHSGSNPSVRYGVLYNSTLVYNLSYYYASRVCYDYSNCYAVADGSFPGLHALICSQNISVNIPILPVNNTNVSYLANAELFDYNYVLSIRNNTFENKTLSIWWLAAHELNVTINTPSNTTYVNRSINASFTLYSPFYSSATCNRYINGTLLATGTILNGSTTIDDTSAWDYFNHNQQYEYTVNCSNATDGSTKYNYSNVNFTALNYNITSTYSNWVYEATNQTIMINVTWADNVFQKQAGVFWNNTNYSAGCNTTGTSLLCYFNPIAAIQTVNNTNFTLTPYVTYSTTALGAATTTNGTALTQAIYYAYGLNTFTADNTRYVEGATSTATLNISNLTSLATVTATLAHYYANGTAKTHSFATPNASTSATMLYRNGYDVSESTAIYEYQTWNASVTYSYGGGTRTEYATNLTINITRMILTNCGAGGYSLTPTINFFVLDEETGAYLENATVEISASVWTGSVLRNYSFIYNLTGTTNDSVCIYPEWGEYNTSAWFYYSATGYSTRSYYLYSNISSSDSDVYLYLLPTTSGALTIIYLIDESGLAIEDYTVQIQRFFVGNGSYITVAQVKTDFEGKGTTYLTPNDVYYRFIVLENATVMKTVSATTIVCGSGTCPPYKITIQIMNSTIPYFLQALGTISHGCEYNETTTILACTAVQTTQLAENFNLKVSKYGLINSTYYCDDYCYSSACVMTCNLSAYGNVSTDYFYYSFYANYPDGVTQLLDRGELGNYRFAIDWGLFGVLITLVLVVAMFFVSGGNPVVSIILSYAALILSYTIGLMPVNLTALTGLGLLVIFIVWKVRT